MCLHLSLNNALVVHSSTGGIMYIDKTRDESLEGCIDDVDGTWVTDNLIIRSLRS